MINTLIVGGGFKLKDTSKIFFNTYDYIIAADSGFDFLEEHGIKPDYLVGDLDSIKSSVEDIDGVEIIKYPTEKNATDMEIAIDKAIDLESDNVTILSAIGTRLDHTLANLTLLKKLLESGAESEIISNYNKVIPLIGKGMILKDDFKYFSIMTFEDTIVSIDGVKYPIENFKVEFGTSRLISNEITEEYATIYTDKFVLLIQSRD